MEVLKTIDNFDPRLQLPNHALIVGMSMSGKTRLIVRLLENIHRINPKPQRIVFCYDQYQEMYGQLQTKLECSGVEMILKQGSKVKLDEFEKLDGQTLLIVDDATEETSSSSDVAKMYTNGRHKNLSVWVVWHTLYAKHAASRLIMQNTSYIFLLPSVRLMSQVFTLDSQLRMQGAIVSAFKCASAMDTDHKYLLLDVGPSAHPDLRIRSQVHKEEQVVFMP